MKVIGIYTIHDSSIAVSVDGEIKVVLELERLMNQRYFPSPKTKTEFISAWSEAIRVVTDFTGIQHFDVCSSNLVGRKQLKIFKTLIKADKWVEVDHHMCHASIGFYDSPFNSALVISSDGGGSVTQFEVFSCTRENGLKTICRYYNSPGQTYEKIATALPEVTGPNYFGEDDPEVLIEGEHSDEKHNDIGPMTNYWSFPGKKMGYAALGKPRKEWFPLMEDLYKTILWQKAIYYNLGHRIGLEDFPIHDNSIARDVAATSQYIFCKEHIDVINKHLEEYLVGGKTPAIDGIVITGGSGLNVCMNQLVVEKFGLPVHVPCAAGDPGISVGACWLVEPPKKFTPLQYIGLPLFDKDLVHRTAMERGARKVTVAEIADLLMQHHVIGVVRGRAEYGPRALGHRSLLAYPDKAEQLTRINKLKRRQFYRPACPSVTEESAVKIFKGRKDSDRILSHEEYLDIYDCDDRFTGLAPSCEATNQFPEGGDPRNFLARSPYMSFAPTMKDECRKMFPAVCHFDNTARLQTVSKDNEPWFYALLQEIGQRNGGYEILINTSFNIKGKPILNRLSEALEILDTEPEDLLPYVVCEDWLFTPKKYTVPVA